MFLASAPKETVILLRSLHKLARGPSLTLIHIKVFLCIALTINLARAGASECRTLSRRTMVFAKLGIVKTYGSVLVVKLCPVPARQRSLNSGFS